MSAHDIVRQLEEDRRQLAHYQDLVDELRQRIQTAERELAHAKPVITGETESDAHMSFREAMEFITSTVFSPVVRITDGLVIECTCEDGEFSSYSTGYVRDPDTACVTWDGSACSDTATYRSLLRDYDGIIDSIFIRLPIAQRFEIGEAGPFDYKIVESGLSGRNGCRPSE